jgi:hypothetical protein
MSWRTALKAAIGFAFGLTVWIALSPAYDRAVAAGAEKLIRAFEQPDVTRLRQVEDGSILVNRIDFDPRSPRPGIRVYDLTFNFILLTTLFAAVPRPASDRNVGGFVGASLILTATHVLGVVAEVMSIYVARLGSWSQLNHSDLERHVWGVASHGYKLVFMFAVVFALWWVFSDRRTGAMRNKKSR